MLVLPGESSYRGLQIAENIKHPCEHISWNDFININIRCFYQWGIAAFERIKVNEGFELYPLYPGALAWDDIDDPQELTYCTQTKEASLNLVKLERDRVAILSPSSSLIAPEYAPKKIVENAIDVICGDSKFNFLEQYSKVAELIESGKRIKLHQQIEGEGDRLPLFIIDVLSLLSEEHINNELKTRPKLKQNLISATNPSSQKLILAWCSILEKEINREILSWAIGDRFEFRWQ